jgi:hypothetical protein
MNKVLRVVLLVLALAGFLLFFSFHVQNIGPSQTVTVGFNQSPWLRWSRVKGLERFTERTEFNFTSWSVAGLVGGIVLMAIRSRIKG